MAKSQDTAVSAEDRAAWLLAAEARNYRAENEVQLREGERICDFPPMPGFALIPETHRAMVFQSLAQTITYRVAQQAEGDANVAIAEAISTGMLPKANNNDAWEGVYRSFIAERIKDAVAARDGVKPEAVKVDPAMLEDTIDLYRSGEKQATYGFDTVIAAAREAAKNKPVKVRKGAKRSTKENKAMTL